MEKTLPLYLGPSVIGSVICREDDVRITLSAKTYITVTGICRAYVRGRNGSLLIGVLSPSNGGFAAEKSISKAELAKKNLSFEEITYAYSLKTEQTAEADSFRWCPVKDIPEHLRRNETVYSLARTTDALFDDALSPTAVAVPLISDRPFPRPDILCLVSPRRINGALYGVVGISKTGFPEKY